MMQRWLFSFCWFFFWLLEAQISCFCCCCCFYLIPLNSDTDFCFYPEASLPRFPTDSALKKCVFNLLWAPALTMASPSPASQHYCCCHQHHVALWGAAYCFFCPIHAGLPADGVVAKLDFVGVDPVPATRGVKSNQSVSETVLGGLTINLISHVQMRSRYYLTSKWSFCPAGWHRWRAWGGGRPPPATAAGPHTGRTRHRRTCRHPLCPTEKKTSHREGGSFFVLHFDRNHSARYQWLTDCRGRGMCGL